MKLQFEHILLIFFLLLFLYYLSRCNRVCGIDSIDGFSVGGENKPERPKNISISQNLNLNNCCNTGPPVLTNCKSVNPPVCLLDGGLDGLRSKCILGKNGSCIPFNSSCNEIDISYCGVDLTNGKCAVSKDYNACINIENSSCSQFNIDKCNGYSTNGKCNLDKNGSCINIENSSCSQFDIHKCKKFYTNGKCKLGKNGSCINIENSSCSQFDFDKCTFRETNGKCKQSVNLNDCIDFKNNVCESFMFYNPAFPGSGDTACSLGETDHRCIYSYDMNLCIDSCPNIKPEKCTSGETKGRCELNASNECIHTCTGLENSSYPLCREKYTSGQCKLNASNQCIKTGINIKEAQCYYLDPDLNSDLCTLEKTGGRCHRVMVKGRIECIPST